MDDPVESWGRFSDAAEADLPEYRALSGLAVVGFVLALLSCLIMVHVGLGFIAVAAVLCCVAALARCASAPSESSGRGLAIAGLVLAVFWLASGVASTQTRQRLLDVHSRKFAVQWFEFLKKGEPEKANELFTPPMARRPLDNTLMDHYLSDSMEYETLEEFVSKPEVAALLTLGDRAEVRHYSFDGSYRDSAFQIFAVTYDDHGTKKSFLVRLTIERTKITDRGVFAWHVGGTRAPWDPDAA